MSQSITILGCGLMGTAFAQAYLQKGYDVTVWNRNHEKCLPLVSQGAKMADSITQALIASPVVLTLVLDYQSLRTLLEKHEDKLDGLDVINLITGSPQDAALMDDYISGLGGHYLDGAISAYPDDIGREATIVNYAGSKDVWARHESTLLIAAGRSRWVGSPVGAANVLDTAMVGAFFTTAIGAFHEAASYACKLGVDVEELAESAEYLIDLMRSEIKTAISSLASKKFTSDQATLSVYVAALKVWQQSMMEAGEPAHLLSANLYTMEMAVAAGRGGLGISAVYVSP